MTDTLKSRIPRRDSINAQVDYRTKKTPFPVIHGVPPEVFFIAALVGDK